MAPPCPSRRTLNVRVRIGCGTTCGRRATEPVGHREKKQLEAAPSGAAPGRWPSPSPTMPWPLGQAHWLVRARPITIEPARTAEASCVVVEASALLGTGPRPC